MTPHLLEEQSAELTAYRSTSFSFTNPSDYVIEYRVPGTPTSLTFNIRPTIIIESNKLRDTLLQTHLRVRRHIATHYKAREDVLFHNEDPYISDKKLVGCFFGIGSWPQDKQRRLTYGMVDDTLKGVFEVLYREERHVGADFFVEIDTLGRIGIGRVAKINPYDGETRTLG